MNSFSSKNRATIIKQLSAVNYDLLVIGGGITGAGIALDAASRGLKVALLDMQDFAAGTSSRSTKLIHGGLRYLKQLEFALVAEVGRERKIIHRNAPHLTKPEAMLLPIMKKGSFGKFTTKLAMIVYERLAGVKKEERHQVLSAKETSLKEPLLPKENLLGGILFYEYRTDDARLTIEILKEAVIKGTTAVNYIKVTGFTYENDIVNGVQAEDQLNGAAFHIKAAYVINAGGPWVDELDGLDNTKNAGKLQITKGVHIVVDQKKLPVKQSLYFDTYDGRMMFIIPREGKTYIGTTDTFYDGDKPHPKITAGDREYILKCVNDYFQAQKLKPGDIESGWAGLRPLIRKPGKKPSEISRKDETFVWESGLITIAGGKLTGYRKMAERVMNKVAEKMLRDLGRKIPVSTTSGIKISGGKMYKSVSFREFVKNKIKEGFTVGFTGEEAEKIVSRYGSNVDAVYNIARKLNMEEPENALPLALRVQLIYTIENEMCVSPADFFTRRTGMLYFEIKVVKSMKEALSAYMRKLLLWDENTSAVFEKQLAEAILEVE
ncbi:MAG: glycerol-3-phosphate dehydrogenase/oxidase [Bacteroidota bacterium]